MLEERKEILCKYLGEPLFEQVQKYFSYLFSEESEKKPLSNRCFIILTRKGFALWQAGVLCGFVDNLKYKNRIISDRCWKKMTISERQEYTKNRDVYIVDDAIITGYDTMSVYITLDPSFCKSRNVVSLSTSYGFKQRASFEYYEDFGDVSIIERREQTAKIMVALYNLAIPFTAESSAYYVGKFPREILEKWKNLSKENINGWQYEETVYDFGGAGKTNSVFVLHAPSLKDENILFRGMRVCYRYLSKQEDPEEKYAEVSLIPWVMFDIIDYQKAIEYLNTLVKKGSWIYDQINNGEVIRKRIVIHRIISYLFADCIMEEFKNDFNNELKENNIEIETYKLNGVEFESFHYYGELLNELHPLTELNRKNIKISKNNPYFELLMSKEKHDKIANALYGTYWEGIEIPDKHTKMSELEVLLCAFRERDVNENTGYLDKPKPRKRFPILFYTGENRGILALNYIRRSMASFHSTILSVDERLYLANVLVPGEGSYLALLKNYDFIWGLHHLVYAGAYKNGIEKEFAIFWNNKKENFEIKLSVVKDDILDVIINLTASFYPDRKEIMQYYEGMLESDFANKTEIDYAIEIAKAFIQNKD